MAAVNESNRNQHVPSIKAPPEYDTPAHINGWRDGAFDAEVKGAMYNYKTPGFVSDYRDAYQESYIAHSKK